MSLPTYSTSQESDQTKMISLLGSYWSKDFPDAAELSTILESRLALDSQNQTNLTVTTDSVARREIPPYSRIEWMPIYISRNRANTGSSAVPLKYGPDMALYGEASTNPLYNKVFKYGDNLSSTDYTIIALPPGIVRTRILCNRMSDPSLVLIEGKDFYIDLNNRLLVLLIDVFSDSRIAKRSVSVAGVDDEEAILWAFASDADKDLIYKIYGYPVGVTAKSSEAYKDFVNAVWDMHTGAPTVTGLTSMISAAWDVPVAKGNETVETILYGRQTQVITDKNVYSFIPESTVIVSVGQVLNSLDRLVDTFEIVEVSRINDGLKLYSNTPVTTAVTIDDRLHWSPSKFTRPRRTVKGIRITGYNESDGSAIVEDLYTNVGAVDDWLDPFADETYGDYYHGPFRNETVTMQRTGLTPHSHVKLAFDLIIAGNWRGNTDLLRWKMIVDGNVVMDTNFSNQSDHQQAYPDIYGIGNNSAFTGVQQRTDTKGNWAYYFDPSVTGNSIYRIETTVPHTASSIKLEFVAENLVSDQWLVIDPYLTERKYSSYLIPAPYFIGRYTAAQFISEFGIDPEASTGDGQMYIEKVMSTGGSWTAPGRPTIVYGTEEIYYTDYIYYYANFWGVRNMSMSLLGADRVELSKYPDSLVQDLGIDGISLGPQFLSGNYLSTLFFVDKEVPLVYELDSTGRAKVSFELGGFPGDVEQYWDDVHARGISMGFTLANYLDKRANPFGDPKASDLPAYVNPMKLVLRHLLGYNLFIVKLKAGLEGPNALDASVLNLLRYVIPPQTAYIVFSTIVVDSETVTAPITEELAVGAGPVLEESVETVISESVPDVKALEGELV
jgi:hypothetical protein